ncbi:MAG: rhodanese-like domain-containing protein [Ornithinimicrobium sp.]
MSANTMAPDRLAEHHAPQELLVLDVRSPAEFESAHIKGSYNVPLGTLTEHRDEVVRHLDRDVVLVCRSGARARQAETALTDTGPANLHVLDGGIAAWQAAGHRVVRGAPRWDLERQVRLVAGSIVVGSVLTSTIVPGAKWVAGGIGSGLTIAALSNSCLMGTMLSKLPYNREADPDPQQLIAALAGR